MRRRVVSVLLVVAVVVGAGALLIEAWLDIAPSLDAAIRRKWTALINSTVDGWLMARLRNQEGRRQQKPVSRPARERAIRSLAGYGLEADEIRAVLRREDTT